MLWRLERATFEHQKGESNRQAMRALVEAGEEPGLLAYAGDVPAGWCALAPRAHYPALARSRMLRKVDEAPVWSIACFFVKKNYRGQGVSIGLLRAAIEYVRGQGGSVLEGYPVEPGQNPVPAVFAWTGVVSAFRKAGFVECARRSEKRPIIRYHLDGPAPTRAPD